MTAKENAPVCETEAASATAQANITTPAQEVEARALYNPLTWRGEDPQQQDGDQAQTQEKKTPDLLLGWHALAAPAKAKMRGKTRRNARRDALAAKRHQAGGATLDALCLAAGVFWLASVCAWLVVGWL